MRVLVAEQLSGKPTPICNFSTAVGSTPGAGGALMLDYERFSATQDIDAELRYSHMHLQSFGSSAEVVQGEASAENLGLVSAPPRADSRLVAAGQPTALACAGGAHTEFLGEQRGALGFTGLTSLGVGLELDSSKYPVFITRTRLVARYMFWQ